MPLFPRPDNTKPHPVRMTGPIPRMNSGKPQMVRKAIGLFLIHRLRRLRRFIRNVSPREFGQSAKSADQDRPLFRLRFLAPL